MRPVTSFRCDCTCFQTVKVMRKIVGYVTVHYVCVEEVARFLKLYLYQSKLLSALSWKCWSGRRAEFS